MTYVESEVEGVFTVKSKRTGIEYDVYDVSGEYFLIFSGKFFYWESMKKFRPVNETAQEIYLKEVEKGKKIILP